MVTRSTQNVHDQPPEYFRGRPSVVNLKHPVAFMIIPQRRMLDTRHQRCHTCYRLCLRHPGCFGRFRPSVDSVPVRILASIANFHTDWTLQKTSTRSDILILECTCPLKLKSPCRLIILTDILAGYEYFRQLSSFSSLYLNRQPLDYCFRICKTFLNLFPPISHSLSLSLSLINNLSLFTKVLCMKYTVLSFPSLFCQVSITTASYQVRLTSELGGIRYNGQ